MADITTETGTLSELTAGDVDYFYVLADSTATIAVGQLLAYDATGHNFVNFAAYAAGIKLAVCAEAKTIAADTRVKAIISGKVNLTKLDATAQADADIEAGLLLNGIIPVTVQA